MTIPEKITRKDIRNMSEEELEISLKEFQKNHPNDCQIVYERSHDCLECHNDDIYNALVKGSYPTKKETLRVTYAHSLMATNQPTDFYDFPKSPEKTSLGFKIAGNRILMPMPKE